MCTILFQLLGAIGYAAVPKLINYQGRLTNSNGQPTDANVTITLRIYDAETTGQLTYSENVGTVGVKNGTYSFLFGGSGSSARNATETFGPTNGVAQVFNHTASNTPILTGSASISDGSVTWTEGASNATLTGNITHSNGAVSAFYLSGVPASGKTLTFTYDYNSSGITGALLDNNESWMEVVIDGLAYSPRKQLVAMPFTLVANEALSFNGKIDESQLTLNDSSSELMSIIASLQGQINHLRAKVNTGDAGHNHSVDRIEPYFNWFFSESFTDSNGDSNTVDTGETNATWGGAFVGYTCGQLSSSDDSETFNLGGSSGWQSRISFLKNHKINFHQTNVSQHGIGAQTSYKIKFIYSDSTSVFSSTVSGTMERSHYGGAIFPNPYPSKIVARVELWTNYTANGTKLNRSYGPLPSGEMVKIKLNLPVQSKNVIATRVDIVGQIPAASTLNYELSDGSSTEAGLALYTKNDYGLSQKPTSLTLHFDAPAIQTVVVRYWFRN